MVLKIYIGYAKFRNEYFVNRRGISNAVEDASTFKDINLLLNYLTNEYSKRKASLVGIDEEIVGEDRKKILSHIKNKVKRLKLTERVSE